MTIGNHGIPSPQEVLSFIAFKTFQPVDPSKPEELHGFLEYMEKVRKVLIVDTHQGSLIITVECNSLEILDKLWEDYCTGYLNEMAQKYLVSEDLLKELGLIDVRLTTTILEEEYKACREHLLQYSGEFKVLFYLHVKAVFICCYYLKHRRLQLYTDQEIVGAVAILRFHSKCDVRY